MPVRFIWNKRIGLYCAAAAGFILFLYWNNFYTSPVSSADLGFHYKMAGTVLNEGMDYVYPPITYILAAIMGNVIGSKLVAMNVLSLVSFSAVYMVIAYFLLEVNTAALVLSGMVISLLLAFNVPLPLIGFEVIRNYFRRYNGLLYFSSFCGDFVLFIYDYCFY